ncbi:MAG: ABC transporter ATP-binding protein/permease [Holosporales bacterium]|nr:ABC transporter ATP-binding protein/permease [Holosporales bacterium]
MSALRFILSALSPYRRYLAGILLGVTVASLDANFKPYLIKMLIDRITETQGASIVPLISLYAGIQILLIGAWSFNDWCVVRYYGPFRVHLITLLTERISRYSYDFFQNYLSGTIVAKINDAFNLIPSLTFVFIYQFISFTLSTLLALVLLEQVHLFFALGMLLFIGVFIILTYLSLKKILPFTTDYAESKAHIWGYLADYFSNIFTVKYFSATEREKNHFQRTAQNFQRKAHLLGDFLNRFYVVQGGIISLYTLCFLGALLYFHEQGTISPGDFALVFMLNLRTFDKLYDLSHQLRGFLTDWGTVKQALKILDLPIEIRDQPTAVPLEVKKGEILFEHVNFSYKDAKVLFKNKSVLIPAGQKVGLVGYSGSGKSTFINLILRLFDVSEGRISIDRQNIQEVTQDSLRSAIAVIPQDLSLFHRTLMENIRYGRPDATDEEVYKAAKDAHIDPFIQNLPKGYETIVGERGMKLSGGQRQRIAIARALLKNAPILILDEATSQLDSFTETDIQESLWRLMQGKTTIVIAHRLSTLLCMDRLLVFENGQIVEDGSHRDLLEKQGFYRRLWDAQSGGFIQVTTDSPSNEESLLSC